MFAGLFFGKGHIMAKTKTTVVELPAMDIQVMTINLVGDSPLVVHKWSDKAKKMMLDKQMQKAEKGKKVAKDPEQDYRDSMYEHPDGGYGFPAVAFKAAAVSACSQIDGMTKVQARGAFHVVGDMVKVDGVPNMREDMVRVGMGTADIRYRGEFKKWKCKLTVRYNARSLSAERIINLFNIAGFAVGVGEYRPEKNGSWGMFSVA